MHSDNTEKWDLYNRYREKTGQTMERGTEIPDGMFRLVVHVAIFNSKGQLLIQRRQKDKSRWADLWDVSVGGHVIAGETSELAAERETLEELGLKISLLGKRPALTLTFGNGFDDMYTIEQEVDITKLVLQEDEVQEVRWATLEEVHAMIDEETFIPYEKSLMDLLFFLRNHSEAHTKL